MAIGVLASIAQADIEFADREGDDVPPITALQCPCHVAVSPDGKQVYDTSSIDDGLVVFSIDAAGGELTFVGEGVEGVAGLDGAGGGDAADPVCGVLRRIDDFDPDSCAP